MNLNRGDKLERTYSNWISENFPNYGYLWSKYFGNNGVNQLLPVANETPDESEKRMSFSEHSYTIFESIISLSIVEKKVTNLQENVSSLEVEEYLELNNQFLLMYAQIGKVWDNIISMREIYKFLEPIDTSELHKFWRDRQPPIHGAKSPQRIEDGVLQIPIPFDGLIKSKVPQWDRLDEFPQHFIDDFVSSQIKEFIQTVNSFYGKLLKKLEEREMKKVNWPVQTETSNIDYTSYTTASGVDSTNLNQQPYSSSLD